MFSDSNPYAGPFVASVGVFDGLHRGHWSILEPMLAEASRLGVPPVLFTFHPRPVAVFAPECEPDELTPVPRKWRLLAEAGIERVVVLRFSREFARIAADRFILDILRAGAGLRGIWIGHDFRFGHRRLGDRLLLERFGERYGFKTCQLGPYQVGGAPVSSTRIRTAIRKGEIREAADLLGRWPDLEGRVIPGRGAGSRLLVPTANLALHESQCLPPNGVYAGEAEWEGRWHPAVLNLGRRPTLTEGAELVPEVHLIDFEGDLRGRRLLFRLRRRLREERKFNNINELRDQVERDIAQIQRGTYD